MWAFGTIAALSCLVAQVIAMDVVNLSDADFDKYVDGSKNVLVEFYAPWCGHCKTLAPEWKAAAELFDPTTDDVVLAAVDATLSPALTARFKVTGYPSILFFKKGSVQHKDYDGGRTAETIVEYINSKVGTTKKFKVAPSHVITLTADNFDSYVLGKKAALVDFYAPWCGHCKTLAPIYEKLATVFAGDKNVMIGKVDVTEHESLSGRFEITGFPTIKFFPAGSDEAETYDEQRELEDLVTYVNAKAGTHRDTDGRLLPTAGRVGQLDEFITKASDIDSTFVDSFTAFISTLDSTHAEASALYLATAAKIYAKGPTYAESEINRLSAMIASKSVSPTSKTSFQLRQNILKAFLKSSNSDDIQ